MQTQRVVQHTPDHIVTSKASPSNNWRVSVDNIGDAGIALVSALKNGLKISQQEIARRLLHAPSILAENLSAEAAQQISDYLNEIGLNARPVGPTDKYEAGVGGFEVAIVDMDFSRTSELLALLVELTGITADDAVKLLSKSPAVILANISKNNAQVLKARFANVGAQLAISDVEDSIYDVLLIGNNYATQRELLQLVKTLQLPNNKKHEHDDTIAIQGLNYSQAQKLWAAAQDRRINCKLLNRSYQRYDIRLENIEAAKTEDVARYLVRQCGIPEKVIGKVLQRLPIGIASGETLEDACALVEALHGIGGDAIADLTATLNFDLEIDSLSRPDKVEQLLTLIGGLSKTQFSKLLKGKGRRVEGPLNYHQARWLQHELSSFGCKVSLKKRG